MKKRGFTLIELLAVIVVLAILALIATPIVTTTIKNAKKGSAEISAQHYIKAVELAVSNSELNKKHIPDGTYTIDSEGNLTGTNLPNGKLEIEATGTKPNGGTIVIKNGQVTTESTMTVGDYDVKYDSTSKEYVATEKGSTQLVCDFVEGTKETVGAKYTCHLDSDRTFYVLETSGDKVSLIMDRNFTDDTVAKTLAWCTDSGSNNTTCKNIASKEEGTPLKHIQDTFGTNVEVSIPSASQIATATGKTFDGTTTMSDSELSTWLKDYLYGTKNSVSGVLGYWTSTPKASNSTQTWCIISSIGLNIIDMSDISNFGIRPVITISKSQLN